MNRLRRYTYGAITAAVLVAVGCNSSEDAVFSSGTSEKKPAPTLLAALKSQADQTAATVTKAASALYVMRLKSASDLKICDGEFRLDIMSDFTVSFPVATVNCLEGQMVIDLKSILQNAAAGAMGKDPMANVAHDGKVLSLKTLAGATFEPARPVLLGPVVQDRTVYEGFEQTTNHTVTTNSGQTASGSFTVKVLNANQTFKNPYMTLDKVIQWEITKSGFEGVKASQGLLLQRMEWWFNTQPIMIPKITIQAEMADFIQDKAGLNALVGVLTIELAAKSFQ